MKDGEQVAAREEINRGAPDRPLSESEIVEKYRANAAMSVSPAVAERIENAVLSLDEAQDLDKFAAAIAG